MSAIKPYCKPPPCYYTAAELALPLKHNEILKYSITNFASLHFQSFLKIVESLKMYCIKITNTDHWQVFFI